MHIFQTTLTRVALAALLIAGASGLTSCDKISSIFNGSQTENAQDSKLEALFEKITSEKLTATDLSGMSQGDMRLLRASIYARHGKIFKDADLTEYFSNFDWYSPKKETVDELLNGVERSNIAYIDEYAGTDLGGSDMKLNDGLTPPNSESVQSKRERNAGAKSGGSRFGHVGFTNDYSDIVCYQYLTDDDVRDLSGPELRILRNTIYARHGRRFVSKDLQNYFSGFSWYTPRVNEVNPNELSAVEKHNIQLIQRYE